MATLPSDSRLIASGTQTTKLGNWKIVKELKTRLTVLRRLGVTCRIEITRVEIQCSPSSGSAPTQLESSENAGHEIRNAFGVCEKLDLDHRRPVFYFPTFLSTFVGIQGRKAADGAPDRGQGISVTAAIATVVTVWLQNIIAASAYGSPLLTGKFLFMISFSLLFDTVHGADDPTENFKEENPDDALKTLYDRAQKAAATLLVILLLGGIGVARRMCNRWRPLRAAQAPGQVARAPANGVQGAPAVAGGAPAVAGGAPVVAGGAPAVAGGAPAVAGGAPAVAGGAPAVGQGPADDIMLGLVQSPVPTLSNLDYTIPPECP